MQAEIIEIGDKAWDESEPMLILFGEKITPELKAYSVVQRFPENVVPATLVVGDTLKFGDQSYTIEKVGRLANANLQELGHVTLVFGPLPTHDELVNALYLNPHTLPKMAVGDKITYPEN
ncbi:PTS glucitol/sorbitol transporter subunit IIA [Enterococcus timonensis]|uniref:PTS glucitol/sorbitol transporter subunit IIA n=1 Tax=Enterococcus timonensis TaxID=1852364 RepID=UPI0008D95FC4|nr:PTS glucitol/sorbitol transporter subunit IIA [Enterococcus timonensis]